MNIEISHEGFDPFMYESLTRPSRNELRKLWAYLLEGQHWERWRDNPADWVQRCLRFAHYEPTQDEIHSIVGHAESIFRIATEESDALIESIQSYMKDCMSELIEPLEDDEFTRVTFLALLGLLCFLYVQWATRKPQYVH